MLGEGSGRDGGSSSSSAAPAVAPRPAVAAAASCRPRFPDALSAPKTARFETESSSEVPAVAASAARSDTGRPAAPASPTQQRNLSVLAAALGTEKAAGAFDSVFSHQGSFKKSGSPSTPADWREESQAERDRARREAEEETRKRENPQARYAWALQKEEERWEAESMRQLMLDEGRAAKSAVTVKFDSDSGEWCPDEGASFRAHGERRGAGGSFHAHACSLSALPKSERGALSPPGQTASAPEFAHGQSVEALYGPSSLSFKRAHVVRRSGDGDEYVLRFKGYDDEVIIPANRVRAVEDEGVRWRWNTSPGAAKPVNAPVDAPVQAESVVQVGSQARAEMEGRLEGNLIKSPTKPCRFWRVGQCRNGDKCRFLHDTPLGSSCNRRLAAARRPRRPQSQIASPANSRPRPGSA